MSGALQDKLQQKLRRKIYSNCEQTKNYATKAKLPVIIKDKNVTVRKVKDRWLFL